MFQIKSEILNLKSEEVINIFGFPITDAMSTTILTLMFVILLIILSSKLSIHKPSKLQLFFEEIIISLENFIVQLGGSKDKIQKILPISLSVIGFILISNLMLIIFPFFGAITLNDKPLFRSSTSDINMTLAIALSMVIFSQLYYVLNNGILHYLNKFIPILNIIKNFKQGLFTGLMSIIDVFLGILDFIGEIAKIASLSLRLLGNMFAGEILLRIFMGIFAIIVPVPIILLGGMSGLVQSIVFGSLVTSYLMSASSQKNN